MLQSPQKVEIMDLRLDWAFRQAGGSASKEDIQIVEEMLRMAGNPEAWNALGLLPDTREQAIGVCSEWLGTLGTPDGRHPERDG